MDVAKGWLFAAPGDSCTVCLELWLSAVMFWCTRLQFIRAVQCRWSEVVKCSVCNGGVTS